MAESERRIFDEVTVFRFTLTPETDRGCALMAAAYLDDQLEALMRGVLLADTRALDELLSGLGPLATFSSRIELCYLLGLIPVKCRRDLHLIRKIRNEFAHGTEPPTFNQSLIANWCTELSYSAQPTAARARAKFTNAAWGVCAVIHGRTETAARFTSPPECLPRQLDQELLARVAAEYESQLSGAETPAERARMMRAAIDKYDAAQSPDLGSESADAREKREGGDG